MFQYFMSRHSLLQHETKMNKTLHEIKECSKNIRILYVDIANNLPQKCSLSNIALNDCKFFLDMRIEKTILNNDFNRLMISIPPNIIGNRLSDFGKKEKYNPSTYTINLYNDDKIIFYKEYNYTHENCKTFNSLDQLLKEINLLVQSQSNMILLHS